MVDGVKGLEVNWKNIRDSALTQSFQEIIVPAIYKYTPKSTFERYGNSYPNWPNFGLMSTKLRWRILRSSESSCTIQWAVLGSKYANYVNNMPDTNNFTTPGTGPHFLERPFIWNQDKFTKRFKDNMMNNIERIIL